MIQVQIASDITATGVSGVRWVLVEPAPQAEPETGPPAATLALTAEAAPTPMPTPVPTEGDWLRLSLFKLLLVVAGMGLALWLASQHLGPPTLPALQGDGKATPALPAPPAAASKTQAASTATTPATTPATAARLITAGLQ